MATAIIDTLRYAEKLERGGVEHSTANEMAHALNDELADHVPTKADLEQRFESMENRGHAIEAKVDAGFDSMDVKFDSMDAKFDAMDVKFEALEAKVDAIDAKFEAKFDSLAASLKVTNAMMILGFGLLGALGFFQLTKDASPVAAPIVIERPVASNAPPVELPP